MRYESPCQTMVDLLRGQAGIDPHGGAYVFDDERDGLVEISFGELDRRARAIAARLQLELRPGDRALLVYSAGLEFISAFFGCLYAGVVAVPATYPKPKRPMPSVRSPLTFHGRLFRPPACPGCANSFKKGAIQIR